MIKSFILILLLAFATFSQVSRNTIVILVNFSDNQSQPYTLAHVADTMTQVDAYYREVSYNQVSISSTIVGWYTIPVSSATCDTASIATYAKQAATNSGVNLSNYQQIVYGFPQLSCGFAGTSTIGGSPAESWINTNNFPLNITAHEMGHGFGLIHSASMDCGQVAFGPNCTVNSTGDVFDIMGGIDPPGHFNVFQKERLGWVNPLLVTNGTYTILPLETNTSGLKMLQSYNSNGKPVYYYIEFRRLIGFDAPYSIYNPFNGVIIHIATPVTWDSYLLDNTPQTLNDYDSALPIGSTFNDGNITIHVDSADDSGSIVNVTTNVVPTPTPTPSPTPSPTPVCVKFNRNGCIKWQ